MAVNMTVKELKEKLLRYPDNMDVYIVSDSQYIEEEMDEVCPGWEKECVLNFSLVYIP
jgi:hypothetical protein